MSYSTRYFWLKLLQLRSKCAAPDSGTDTLIYNKQVLRNTALHIHHRKVHMSLKTGLIQSTRTVRYPPQIEEEKKQKQLLSFLSDDTLSSRAL